MVPKDKTSSPIDSLYPNAPIRGPKKSPGRPPKKDPAKTQAEAPVATYSGRGSQTIVRKSNDLIQNAKIDAAHFCDDQAVGYRAAPVRNVHL